MQLKTFADTHIPIFFSQYGCNLGACGKRIFQETSAIYSSAMTSVFSGGIAYEFYDSPENRSGHWGYGLVRTEATPAGRGLTKLPDFGSLKSRLEAVDKDLHAQDVPVVTDMGQARKPKDVPPLSSHWRAGQALPYSLADWSGIRKSLDEKAWYEVEVGDVDDSDLTTSRPKAIPA